MQAVLEIPPKHEPNSRSLSTIAVRPIVLTAALLATQVAPAASEAPTQAIVEGVMKQAWDQTATALHPRSVLTLNSVKFGKATVATLQEVQLDGIPDKAMVTPAIVDFTVRSYEKHETQAVRRVRQARVYKDKMDEWTVMTRSVKGQDTTATEPALK